MTVYRSSALAYAQRILADRTTSISRPDVRKLARRVLELSKKKSVGDRAQRRELHAAKVRIKILTARYQIAESDAAALRKQVRALEVALRKAQG